MLGPSVCRYDHFLTDWYRKWTSLIGFPVEVIPGLEISYRKLWEFAVILESLDRRGMLQPGRKGLGFAVGREVLPSIMAAHGVQVLATDLMSEKVEACWSETGQHAASREAVYAPHLVEREVFERLVEYEGADMNDLSTMTGEYDFVWSSCAFEHLGSLGHGLAFVENAMRLVKPGGYAIHTTEHNISSNDETLSGYCSLYRRRDFEVLERNLKRIGCTMEPIDFNPGTTKFDFDYDPPPYWQEGKVHIKLEIAGHICTSMMIIVQKDLDAPHHPATMTGSARAETGAPAPGASAAADMKHLHPANPAEPVIA